MLHLATYIPEMIETRRHLHHHPEIAWTEFLTTQTIVKRVRELGFKTILGKALFDTLWVVKKKSLKKRCNAL